MASPGARGAPECPDRSPPGSQVSLQSSVPRPGAAAGGAGPAPSDVECGADPCANGRGGAVSWHDPTSAPSLPVAALVQPAGAPYTHQMSRGRGEGGSPPPHRGEAAAWP